MSVRDGRRPPFAWIGVDALRAIRQGIPLSRQAGARSAILTLAEAASLRKDGMHQEGDALRELAALGGVSERRLREHLNDLAGIGLVVIEAPVDLAGRDLPKIYALLDLGSDESSTRVDAASDNRLPNCPPLTRARVTNQEEEQEPPLPPANGGRQRDQREFLNDCAAYAQVHFPDLGERVGRDAVRQAVTYGKASTLAQVIAFVDEWFRDAVEQLEAMP